MPDGEKASVDSPKDNASALTALTDVAAVIFRVSRFLWKAAPAHFVVQCVLLIANAAIPAAIIWMTKVTIDSVLDGPDDAGGWSAALAPVGIILGLWILQATCDELSAFTESLFDERAWYAAYREVLERAGTVDLAHFDTPTFYDELHYANQHMHRMPTITRACLGVIRHGCSLLAMVGLLSVLHPLAIAILIGSTVPRVVAEGLAAKRRYRMESDLVRSNRMIEYVRWLLTSRENAKEVRAFRLPRLLLSRFEGHRRAYVDRLTDFLRLTLKRNVVCSVVSVSGTATIWAYAVVEATMARLSVGDLALVFQASQRAASSLSGFYGNVVQVYENSLFASRFFKLIDVTLPPIPGSLSRSPDHPGLLFPKHVNDGIEFRSVSFTYPSTNVNVLNGVSFRVGVGQTVAIVGKNGAGKTTITKLLARLYDPTAGSILLDGRDLRDYDVADLRRNVSVMFQDFSRYDMPVADNIGIGCVEAVHDRSAIVAAARQAGAHGIAERLPHGYDTVLGRTLDEGVDLSGGEWQRIAMARAMMGDAKVLILDEPLAAVDALREHEFYEWLAKAAPARISVLVSHRFSTVRMADLILVVENGSVVEAGNHVQLLAKEGRYAEMFALQAAKYR